MWLDQMAIDVCWRYLFLKCHAHGWGLRIQWHPRAHMFPGPEEELHTKGFSLLYKVKMAPWAWAPSFSCTKVVLWVWPISNVHGNQNEEQRPQVRVDGGFTLERADKFETNFLKWWKVFRNEVAKDIRYSVIYNQNQSKYNENTILNEF